MKQIWYFFLKNHRFTYLVILAVVLAGALSAFLLPKEANPEVKVPIGVVTTFYPGASASDVERLVTDEIEKEVETLEEVDNFSSASREGFSSVIVEFNASADIDDRIRALKDAARQAESELPDEAENPIITEVSFDEFPIVVLSLTAEVPEIQLKEAAEDLQDELEKITGVSEVRLTGIREQKVFLTIDKDRLDQFDISLFQVLQALQQNNLAFPIGSIQTDNIRYTVRLDGELTDPDQIGNIALFDKNDVPIYLRDIASVDFTFEKATTYSRVSEDGEPSSDAVSLLIFKKTGGNILQIAENTKNEAERLIAEQFPEGSIFVSVDNAKEIGESLGNLLRNGFSTVIIIAILLFLFLGWREAILAGISIPITFMFGFIGLSLLDSSINFLSLFSLILALGIVVDTGIVIIEGLHDHIYRQGKEPMQAAKDTIAEFQWPLISGTLTTVSAFIPMLFMSGILGEFVKHIPTTVTLVLFGSLFTALALMPVVGSNFLKPKDNRSKANKLHDKYIMPYINKLHDWYKARITSFLHSRKQKMTLAIGLVFAFVISLSLPIIGVLKIELFPANDSDFFYIDVEAPVGTTLEVTDQVVRQVEELLYQDDRVESYIVNIGSGNSQTDDSAGGVTTHLANFTVNLLEERKERTPEILNQYRDLVSNINEADVKVTQLESGPPTGAPVLIRFSGDDLGQLEQLANQAKSIVEEIEGTTEVDTSVEEAAFEFAFEVDREQAARYGVSTFEIANLLRTAVEGSKATSIRYQGEDLDVVVQLELNQFSTGDIEKRTITTIDEIEQMLLPTPNGTVSVSQLLKTDLRPGTTTIRHEDGVRDVSVTAQLDGSKTAGEIFEEFENISDSKIIIPSGYDMKLGGEAEDVQESFRDLFNALFLGVFLIAAILLLQFNSYRQPLFIMVTLPLALIGIFPGLALMGQTFNFPAFIGVVALAGVVVNDAIILIDKINRNIKSGMDRMNGIINAGVSRLQPILLTTVTTVAGILPLALSDPIWGPLGFSMIFGLMFATLLTLFVVPMLYLRFARK